MNFDQIEFQLKYHIMERAVLAKEHEVQTLEARLQSVSAIKIQSQDSILQIIGEVHNTMKGISKIVVQLKDPFNQLKINSLYQMFKNICCVMVSAVRILAEGCGNGVQRNLLKFTQKNDDKKVQIYQTLCLQEKIQELKKKQQQNKRLSKKQQYFNDVRTKMEIDKIYESVQTQKQSVRRITASNVVNKLNQVRNDWMKMINDSDKILQQAYSRKNQGQKQIFAQKLHKPQYITKVLKQELSNSIKMYFKQSVQKVIKKLYNQFYIFEYNKLKADLLKYRPATTEQYQQTEIEGMSAIKQMIREKKNYDKITKQLQSLQQQKNQLVEQYMKATRNNELYVNRIQQLQRKLINLIPVKNLQKKLSESRKSIRQSRRNSSRESIHQMEDDRVRNQSKFNISGYNFAANQNKGETTENQLIIKKRAKLKRIYTKSRMHTQKIQSSKNIQHHNNTTSDYKQSLNKLQQNFKFTDNQKQIRQEYNIQKIQNNKNIQEQIKIIKQQEFKQVIIKLLQIIKKSNLVNQNYVSSEVTAISQKNKQILNQDRNIEDKTQNLIMKNEDKSEFIHNQQLQKVISNSQISNIFYNLVRRITLANNLMKSTESGVMQNNNLNNEQQKQNKQDLNQIDLKNNKAKIKIKQIIMTDNKIRHFASQRLSKNRSSQFSRNLLNNLLNLKQYNNENKKQIHIDMSEVANKKILNRQHSYRISKQKQQDSHMINKLKMKTITEFDQIQNLDHVVYQDIKSYKPNKFTNKLLKETLTNNRQQSVPTSVLPNHKRIQSDNHQIRHINMLQTLPSALQTGKIQGRNHFQDQSIERFDKIDLQNEQDVMRQTKRKQNGIQALKNIAEISQKNNLKSQKVQKTKKNKRKQQQQPQNRLFSIQKVRPSTKQEHKKALNQQKIIKGILSICKNYRSSNINLESMISQYIGINIWQLNSQNLPEVSVQKLNF